MKQLQIKDKKLTLIQCYYNYSWKGGCVQCILGEMAKQAGIPFPKAVGEKIDAKNVLRFRVALEKAYGVTLGELMELQRLNDASMEYGEKETLAQLKKALVRFGLVKNSSFKIRMLTRDDVDGSE